MTLNIQIAYNIILIFFYDMKKHYLLSTVVNKSIFLCINKQNQKAVIFLYSFLQEPNIIPPHPTPQSIMHADHLLK